MFISRFSHSAFNLFLAVVVGECFFSPIVWFRPRTIPFMFSVAHIPFPEYVLSCLEKPLYIYNIRPKLIIATQATEKLDFLPGLGCVRYIGIPIRLNGATDGVVRIAEQQQKIRNLFDANESIMLRSTTNAKLRRFRDAFVSSVQR